MTVVDYVLILLSWTFFIIYSQTTEDYISSSLICKNYTTHLVQFNSFMEAASLACGILMIIYTFYELAYLVVKVMQDFMKTRAKERVK